jgi:hypothetical protein
MIVIFETSWIGSVGNAIKISTMLLNINFFPIRMENWLELPTVGVVIML